MHAQRAPATFRKHLEVTARLRRLHHTERVLLPGHRNVLGVVTRDLEEYAAVRAALVRLPGRVEEARSEAQTRGDFLRVAHAVSNALERHFVRLVHLDIRE